jgi:XTP/dITP diphosphohydrolase
MHVNRIWVLASGNPKKLLELQTLLQPLGMDLRSQTELGIPETAEPFGTFVENALTKARHAARAAGTAAIADDSGLCVRALTGAPGVRSARYAQDAGHPASDHANNQLLLQHLQDQSDRRAYFVCVLVALRHADDPEPLVVAARWHGEILYKPQGNSGFGYDPLMWITAFGCSVAELSAEQKNQHSHRAKAALELVRLLKTDVLS